MNTPSPKWATQELQRAAPVYFEGQNNTTIHDVGGFYSAEEIRESIFGDVGVAGREVAAVQNTARLVRLGLDSFRTSPKKLELINDLASFALYVFNGTVDASVREAHIPSILSVTPRGVMLEQNYDATSLHASMPENVCTMLDTISSQLSKSSQEADILQIPLCHGGFIAGSAAFLALQQAYPTRNLDMYPVRFSYRKKGDKEPVLSGEELEYLDELSEGRHVLVTDEDVDTGKTANKALNYFRKNLRSASDITFATALYCDDSIDL